eukprot:3596641-Amphidinium_carterae.1
MLSLDAFFAALHHKTHPTETRFVCANSKYSTHYVHLLASLAESLDCFLIVDILRRHGNSFMENRV